MPLSCQIPLPLQPGDLLRVISPSGALPDVQKVLAGVEIWRHHGYRVELTPGYDLRAGYLAGTDHQRWHQLHLALTDPDCRGILCARGGYGGARLLEWGSHHGKLQLDRSAPKWLIGFSDVTSLLWAFWHQGISGIHGPLLTTLSQEPDWCQARLFSWVAGQRSLSPLQGKGWGQGAATGILLPANLTVATSLLHTPYQPRLDGVILAWEDVSEAPYRIDRMITHWRMSGALAQVKGIALGRFSQCHAPAKVTSWTVDEVLHDRLGDLGIPIVSDLPFGHDGENAALPVGVPARLDGESGTLTLEVPLK